MHVVVQHDDGRGRLRSCFPATRRDRGRGERTGPRPSSILGTLSGIDTSCSLQKWKRFDGCRRGPCWRTRTRTLPSSVRRREFLGEVPVGPSRVPRPTSEFGGKAERGAYVAGSFLPSRVVLEALREANRPERPGKGGHVDRLGSVRIATCCSMAIGSRRSSSFQRRFVERSRSKARAEERWKRDTSSRARRRVHRQERRMLPPPPRASRGNLARHRHPYEPHAISPRLARTFPSVTTTSTIHLALPFVPLLAPGCGPQP